jgi:hypothetical protein
MRPEGSEITGGAHPDVASADELAAIESQYDRVQEEKRRALAAPGPSWRDWFLFDASRWWVALLYLIVDSWIVSFWLEQGPWDATWTALLVGSLVGACYLEFLLFRFLWYRPSPDQRGRRGSFRRTWFRPVQFGRWTPEADRLRAGLPLRPADAGPDPSEFL